MASGLPTFRRLDDQSFEATAAAGGPWSDRHCHGGAPAALLAHAIEAVPSAVPMDLARLTVDLIRPVPIGERLDVELREEQTGRKALRLHARLLMGEVTLASATALKVRSQPSAVLARVHHTPDAQGHRPMPGGFSSRFKIVPLVGGFGGPGPADVWFRLDGALVCGADPSPVERAVAAADFGSGIAHALRFEEWEFPSLDLTVTFARAPVGAWTLLESRWLSAEGGRTVCLTALSDVHGRFGEATQTVLLEPRAHQ